MTTDSKLSNVLVAAARKAGQVWPVMAALAAKSKSADDFADEFKKSYDSALKELTSKKMGKYRVYAVEAHTSLASPRKYKSILVHALSAGVPIEGGESIRDVRRALKELEDEALDEGKGSGGGGGKSLAEILQGLVDKYGLTPVRKELDKFS